MRVERKFRWLLLNRFLTANRHAVRASVTVVAMIQSLSPQNKSRLLWAFEGRGFRSNLRSTNHTIFASGETPKTYSLTGQLDIPLNKACSGIPG